MAKVKSIIVEDEVGMLEDVSVEFVSLVGHAANRSPFKIIKGEIEGDEHMKKTIYSILVDKNTTEEKLQEIVKEHNFSIDEKDETALEGYDVYKQIEDDEVDLETKKMAKLDEGIFTVVADLKEDSEKEGIEKEMDYETMEKVADSLFEMMDIVLGTIRQPEADGTSRKEMIMSAVSNFTSYVEATLSTMKAEEVLEDFEIKSEIIKEFIPAEKIDDVEEKEEFDSEEFETRIKEELISTFTEMIESQVGLVKNDFEETKKTLNESLNEQFELYLKKEDSEKEIATVKSEIEDLRNTTKSRNSEIDENVHKKKKETKTKKQHQFVTFV